MFQKADYMQMASVLEDVYDVGEGMAIQCTSQDGRVLLNKQTGKSLRLVDAL